MEERIEAKAAHVGVLMFLDNGECRQVVRPKHLTEEEYIKGVMGATSNPAGSIILSAETLGLKWRA